jgi:response regulator RpfG family c-di-GMP phosphodiesterase
LKVLFIGNIPEENQNIAKMMSHQYPKITLVKASESANLVELITTDGPFSFVIVNINNKNLNVINVYETINEILGSRPFVFIGNQNSVKSQLSSEILDNQETNAVLDFPLNPEEFKKAIDMACDWVKKEEFEQSILEFSRDDLHPMRLRNFYLFEQLPYDVYIELTSSKFGKIISKNKFYSHQIIQNYSRKNIKYLYLRKDEHLKFLDTSIKNLSKIYSSKLTDKKKYVTLHLKTVFFIQQFIKTVSISDDVNKLVHLYIESVCDLGRAFDNLGDMIELVTEGGNMSFAEQSVATAYTCEKILTAMGWNADMSRGKLILASILYDIGLNNDDLIKIRSINDPQLKMLSEEEQEEFKNHPAKAAHLSTFFTGFSDVDFILMEQHEHPSGDGFPKGLNSTGLTTISCIFILASNFVSRLAQGPKGPALQRDIIISMRKIYGTGNFKDPLKALEKTLKKPTTR